MKRSPSSCRRITSFLLLCAMAVLAVPAVAGDVQTPVIESTVYAGDREVIIEWNHPDSSLITSLTENDSIWGGTATFKILGEFTENCDLDLNFRTSNETVEFTPPFIDTVLFQGEDPNHPNYWTGDATPYAGGELEVCENHSIQLVALGSDSLTEEGNASHATLSFFWLDVPDTGTVHLPPDFAAGKDTILVSSGVWVSFLPGKVNEGDELGIRIRSRDVNLAWDYVLTGAEEADRISSSDPGEDELTICYPGEIVPFRFGLSVTITVDTIYHDVTTYDTLVVIDPESGETTGVTIDTTTTTEADVQGSVVSGGDSLGIVSVAFRKIDGYRIYRSEITDPDRFSLLREYRFCDDEDLEFLENDPLHFVDRDGVHNGFPYVYYVTAYDTLTGSESDTLRSDKTFPRTEATEDLSRIMVVPNPYKRNAAWEEGGEEIQFTHLPQRATLRVYSIGGDLVREWDHYDPAGGGNSNWDTRNENGDLVVSGVYLYYVKSATGEERVGKFIIVR